MLTPSELTQLVALINREGSTDSVFQQVQAAQQNDQYTTGLAALQGVVTVTVNDWTKLRQVFNQASKYRLALQPVMADIIAAGTAGDASNLGPLLVLLAASIRPVQG